MYLLNVGVSDSSIIYEVLMALGVIALAGLYGGRLIEKIGIPNITGYLLAGILIGPSLFGFITHDHIAALDLVTNLALGFIAFGIGMEILFKQLKKTGKQVLIITLFQGVFAALAVIVALKVFGAPTWFALIVGAIATATAPTPIVLIVKQFRAKGPVTDTLLPLVGIDDAMGIVVFGIFLSIAVGLYNGIETTLIEMLLDPLMEIVLSAVVGAVIGFVMWAAVFFEKGESRSYTLIITTVGIMFSVALASIGVFGFHLSVILTPMVAGLIYGNLTQTETLHRTMLVMDAFDPIFIISLFVLAGAMLDLSIFTDFSKGGQILFFGAIYLIVRVIGKVVGAWIGAKMSGADENVQKYIGLALMPQGGIEIGLANATMVALGGAAGNQVLTIVMLASLVYGLVAPSVVKWTLIKAGEIDTKML